MKDILIHFDLKINLLFKDSNKYITDIKEIQVLNNVEISLYSEIICEAGLFIPIGVGEMYISFGLLGILSSVKLQIELYFNILKNNYIIDINFHVYKIDIFFFLKIGIHIDLKLISIRFDFYIFLLVIPYSSFEANFYRVYSYRNKLLEKSGSAKLTLFGMFAVNLKFIPKLVDKNLFSKLESE